MPTFFIQSVMLAIFKYLVFSFLFFNISAVYAENIILDLEELPVEKTDSYAFDSLQNIPQPAYLRDFLKNKDLPVTDKLLTIAQYFHIRYPDQLIDTDFSDAVSELFPELSLQEVYDREVLIRRIVKLYRFGREKIEQIKETILAPEEPPLMIEEKDLENADLPYFDAGDGRFAVRYDFKKVVPYSHQERDIKAISALRQRQANQKKQKTNFEKFKSMVEKIEFSKIPFYGVSEPNPFVGNAGVGSWVEDDGFRLRLISQFAEYASEDNLLVAVHFQVPPTQFVEALQHKPQIQIKTHETPIEAQVFYPMPSALVDEEMVGGYGGDFAIPVMLKGIQNYSDLNLQANVTFDACSFEKVCQTHSVPLELQLHHGLDTVSSGMENFIKQSYYNVPQEKNNHLYLEQAYPLFDESGQNIEALRFVFGYKGTYHPLTFFITDRLGTRFSSPQVTMFENKIYLTVQPLNHQDKILEGTFEISAQLNPFTKIRFQTKLQAAPESQAEFGMYRLALVSFLAGFLFHLSLAGLCLWAVSNYIQNRRLFLKGFLLSVFVCIFGATFVLWKFGFYYGIQYQSAGYLMFMLLISSALFMLLKSGTLFPQHEFLKGILQGIVTTLYFPISYTPFLPQALSVFYFENLTNVFISAFSVCSGLGAFCFLMLPQISNLKLRQIVFILARVLAIFLMGYFVLLIVLQFDFVVIVKCLALFLIALCIGFYIFRFLLALNQTELQNTQKTKSFYIVSAFYLLIIFALAFYAHRFLPQTTQAPVINQALIIEQIQNGQNVLLALDAPWCFECQYNRLSVFSSKELDRLKTQFPLVYMPVSVSVINQQMMEYLNTYKHSSLPLYVFYNYRFQDGLVLPDILNSGDLERIFNDLY